MMLRGMRVVAFTAACLIAPLSAQAVTIDTVPVGNPGNAGEVQEEGTFGGVSYDYRIGTTEVTNAQYAEFLNAKAASDPLALYNENMAPYDAITRTGSDGSYTYATVSGREDMPVMWVSWYDSIRFANWLHNDQGSGDTETGAYTLEGGTPTPSNGVSITRNAGATWFLTSEDEWYKAAYHKNDGATSNYFEFPTNSDTVPTAEAPPGGGNSANYNDSFAVGDSTVVGAYTSSDSPYGTFDQGGNVFEWNEALISGSFRGLRGGSWVGDSHYLPASFRLESDPSSDYLDVGFRVGTIPEPSTFGLAVLASGIVFWFSKRHGRRCPAVCRATRALERSDLERKR